jgi:hypothetical protein
MYSDALPPSSPMPSDDEDDSSNFSSEDDEGSEVSTVEAEVASTGLATSVLEPVVAPMDTSGAEIPSSDGIIFSSPVRGNKLERTAKRREKGAKKAQGKRDAIVEKKKVEAQREKQDEATAHQAELELAQAKGKAKIDERKSYFDLVLTDMNRNGYSLVDFLLHVFDPSINFPFDWRWKGFFAHTTKVKELLQFWVSSDYPESARKLLTQFAIGVVEKVVGEEARGASDSKIFHSGMREVNAEYFVDFSFVNQSALLTSRCPTMSRIAKAFSSTSRQDKELTKKGLERKELVSLGR